MRKKAAKIYEGNKKKKSIFILLWLFLLSHLVFCCNNYNKQKGHKKIVCISSIVIVGVTNHKINYAKFDKKVGKKCKVK